MNRLSCRACSVRPRLRAWQRSRRILTWAEAHQPLHQEYGSGATYAGCFIGVKDERAWFLPIGVHNGANAAVEIQFGLMTTVPYAPFHTRERRAELRSRIMDAIDVDLPIERLEKRPSSGLSLLTDEGRMNRFLVVCDWALAEAREAGVGTAAHAEWKKELRADSE